MFGISWFLYAVMLIVVSSFSGDKISIYLKIILALIMIGLVDILRSFLRIYECSFLMK